MGIRGSVSVAAEQIVERDNVIIGKVNLKDHRGTVDPNSNPYEGSSLDRAGVDQEEARPVIMGLANVSPSGIGVPNEFHVRDLLSYVRMPDNHGWGVETRYRQRVRSPLTGIRGFCVVTCQSGSAKAVSECSNLSCPLWALRLGRNAHYGKKARS